MKVNFTGRHVEVSEALKEHAHARLDKLASFLDDIIDVHVIFSVEKQHRHTAEITLKTRSANLVASERLSWRGVVQGLAATEAYARARQQWLGQQTACAG